MAVVGVALPVAAHQLFHYWLPAGLAVRLGSVLRVRLARRRLIGVAVHIGDHADVDHESLLPIDEILIDMPEVPQDLRALAEFVSSYYQQPIGQCYAQLLPSLGQGSARAPVAGLYRLTTE